MNNFFSIAILLYCYIVFLAGPVKAFDFVKSSNNPLSIKYINDYVYPQQADIYKEDSLYKGILTARRSTESYNSLVAIESTDGINWQMTKEIFNIKEDVSNPRLFTDIQGNKKLLFAKRDGTDFYRIYSSDCNTNLNCSNIQLLLDPNKNDSSEKNGYFAPLPIIINDNYYLFYGVWGSDGFKIRMAISSNFQTWNKCSTNLISGGADGPFPLIEDSSLYLFYHRSDGSGIKLAKTSLPLTCNSVFDDQGYLLTKGTTYDIRHLIFPSVIKENSGLKLYYSGADSNWNWSLNLACTGEACLLPTATPTPIVKTPIVIIPGFMASWNKEAILHNQSVDYNQWHLFSFIKEYNGLITTLKNLGYEENKNLFVFTYDWRKKLDNIADDLNNYLDKLTTNNQFPTTNFQLIGHSLGGLVARVYSEKYLDKNKVEKLVTVASPHYGVVQVYKPLEAGEIDRENSFLWLTEKIIINLNRGLFQTDKEIIQNILPVAYDLFPTFSFLKDENGQSIDSNSLKISNQTLNTYNKDFSKIFPFFTAIYGEKDELSTVAGYEVTTASSLNQLFGNYQDGQPIETFKDKGDYLVLSQSAKNNDDDSYNLPLDHGELIYKKEAIKKILDTLEINYQDSQIIEGEKTIISPSLIFFIKSPATIEVTIDDKKYLEDEGVIFIDNAPSGNYQLKVKGTESGSFQVIVGQITENNDVWEEINGKTNNEQVDTYQFPSPTPTATIIPTPTATPSLTPTPTAISTSSPSSNNSSNNSNSSSPISNQPLFTSNKSLISSLTDINPSPTITSSKTKGMVLGSQIKKQTKKKNNLLEIIISAIPILSVFGYYLKKIISKRNVKA